MLPALRTDGSDVPSMYFYCVKYSDIVDQLDRLGDVVDFTHGSPSVIYGIVVFFCSTFITLHVLNSYMYIHSHIFMT